MVEQAKPVHVPGSKFKELDIHPSGRFNEAYPQGGMILDDSENSMTKTAKNLLYQMGSNLMKGKLFDCLKVSMPAQIHIPKTYLHMIQKDAGYYEFFCRNAMARPDDPVWKIKNVLLAQLCALHSVVEQGAKSPLNPILGETLTTQSESGTVLYLEQTCHHPPISHFQIEGPEDCPFRMSGHVEYTVKVGSTFTYCECTFPGKIELELPDGTKYALEQPKCTIEGIMSAQKVLNVVDEMELRDLTNLFSARVSFDAQKSKRTTGMMRFVKGSDKVGKDGVYQNRKDLINVEIIKLSEDAESEVVDRGTGSYLEKIQFENDDEPMWTINSEVLRSAWLAEPPIMVLESDSTKRPDLHAIAAKDWDNAEAAKHELEELQRKDKKLREEAKARRGE